MRKIKDNSIILIKSRGGYIKEKSLIDFIESYEDRKNEVVASLKPSFPYIFKKWRGYSYFENFYLQIPPTEKQIKRIKRIGGDINEATSYHKAKRKIAELEAKLPPTPAVEKALKKCGEDPQNYTRETARLFFEEKEKEKEEEKKSVFVEKLKSCGVAFIGDPSSIEFDDIELFEEFEKELKTQNLRYPLPGNISVAEFKRELEIMDSSTCFFDDMPDHLQDLKECDDISRKLKKSEIKVLFPDYINLLRENKEDVEDILEIIRKHFPEIIK